jgi:hypothetical protein
MRRASQPVGAEALITIRSFMRRGSTAPFGQLGQVDDEVGGQAGHASVEVAGVETLRASACELDVRMAKLLVAASDLIK